MRGRRLALPSHMAGPNKSEISISFASDSKNSLGDELYPTSGIMYRFQTTGSTGGSYVLPQRSKGIKYGFNT